MISRTPPFSWFIILLAGASIMAFLALFLFTPTLALGLAFVTLGWFVYRKNPLFLLGAILLSITVGEVGQIVVLNYTYEINLIEILILLTTGYFLFDAILKKRFDFRLTSMGFLLLLFLILQSLSLFWAFSPSRVLIALRMTSYHLLILFLTVNIIRTHKDAKDALKLLPLTGLAIALQLLYTVVKLGGLTSGTVVPRTQIITAAGPWVTISAMIYMTLPILYAFIQEKMSKQKRYLLFGIILIMILSGFLAIGKTEIAALIIGSLYFLKKGGHWKKQFLAVGGLVVLLLFVPPFLGYTTSLIERIAQTTSSDTTDFRLAEWRIGKQSFFERPLLGVGAGNLKVFYQMKHPCHCVSEASNTILSIMVEFGIPGLLLLLLAIRDITLRMRILWKKEHHQYVLALSTSLLMVIIMSQAEATFMGLKFGVLFWYFIGVIVAYSALTPPQKPLPEKSELETIEEI